MDEERQEMQVRGEKQELILKEWPIYMWTVSLANAAFAGLFTWVWVQGMRDWWRVVLLISFYLALLITLYMSKFEKLVLYKAKDKQSYVIEKRLLWIGPTNKFFVSQITTIKFREQGKSSRSFYIDVFLVDGRCFTLFKSGIRSRAMRKQFEIRRFVEEYFDRGDDRDDF